MVKLAMIEDGFHSMYWMDKDEREKMRRWLYDEAWDIMKSLAQEYTPDFYYDHNDKKLAAIKDALYILGEMETR